MKNGFLKIAQENRSEAINSVEIFARYITYTRLASGSSTNDEKSIEKKANLLNRRKTQIGNLKYNKNGRSNKHT